MISLDVRTSELIISSITIAIAYVITTTFAGFMQAWVAYLLGDDSAQEAGFLSINPLVHIDPIGAFCLFFLGIGWGKFIPIDVDRLRNWFEVALVFFTRPFSYLLCAFASLLALVGYFGGQAINLIMVMVVSDYVSLAALARAYPASSSLTLSIAMILIMIIYIGVMFAVLNLILDGFRCLQLMYAHRIPASPEYEFIMFLIPVLLMVLFSRSLRLIMSYVITYSAYMILTLFGAL